MSDRPVFTVTWDNGEEIREVNISVDWDEETEDYFLRLEDEYQVAGEYIPTMKETAYAIGLKFMKWSNHIG